MVQLCRSCIGSGWDGKRLRMVCTEERARGKQDRCPNVRFCDYYAREPGSDDYIGEDEHNEIGKAA